MPPQRTSPYILESDMPRIARTFSWLAAAFLVLGAPLAHAADNTWPRELKTDKGVLTIYQPQPEKFNDNVLEARAAVSMIPNGKTTAIFGVMWFTGHVDTDRDKGTATLRDIKVTRARWPESEDTKEYQFVAFLN